MNPLTDKEYVERGGCFCPFCRSSDISGDSVEVDDAGARQEVICNSCERSWTDYYELKGYNPNSQ